MNADSLVQELETALRIGDTSAAAEIVSGLAGVNMTTPQANRLLNLLRRKSQHELLERAAAIVVEIQPDNILAKTKRAQALIELDRLPQAQGLLQGMQLQAESIPMNIQSEIQGLIGRVFKQRFVSTGQSTDLQQAINAYQIGWLNREADYRWHGINLVALSLRAKKLGISSFGIMDPASIARQILDEISKLEFDQQATAWDYGTALEASVAMNNDVSAKHWLNSYIHHPSADAFELSSTLRQMQEIWQLNDTPLGTGIIPVLQFAALQRKGGQVNLEKTGPLPDRAEPIFEAIYAEESGTHMLWLETLLGKRNAIARIINHNTGKPWGTGFLIDAGKLDKTLSGISLLITNAHVISEEPNDNAPLTREQAAAEFTALDGRPKIRLGNRISYSRPGALDIHIFQIECPPDGTTLAPFFHLPVAMEDQDGGKPQRIYIIGHPNGKDLTATLYDNALTGIREPYFHYRSPTEGGSSGSPVFNEELDLIGIHHATRPELKVNEGVAFRYIRERFAETLLGG